MHLKSFKILFLFVSLSVLLFLALIQNIPSIEKSSPVLLLEEKLIMKNCSCIADVFGKKKEMKDILASISPFKPIIVDLNIVRCFIEEQSCFKIAKSGRLRFGLVPKQWSIFRQVSVLKFV